MGRTLQRFLVFVEALSLWSGRLAAWLTLAAVLILTVEVVRRYFFNAPTQWAHEVSTLLFGLLYAFTGAYALKEKAHVGVDVFYARLSPKGRAWVNLLGFVFLALFCGTLLVYGWKFFGPPGRTGSSPWLTRQSPSSSSSWRFPWGCPDLAPRPGQSRTGPQGASGEGGRACPLRPSLG